MNHRRLFLIAALWLASPTFAFVVLLPTRTQQQNTFTTTCRNAEPPPAEKEKKYRPVRKKITIAELREELLKNPESLRGPSDTKKKRSRRTRQRVDAPKQSYMYAAQRAKQKSTSSEEEPNDNESDDETGTATAASNVQDEYSPLVQARQLGVANAANQHCDALVDQVAPAILGQIRVGDETGSGAYAYLIQKPAGWSILGGAGGGGKKQTPEATTITKSKKKNTKQRVKFKADDGSVDYLEFNEEDVLALLTPAELAEFKAQGLPLVEWSDSGPAYDDTTEDPSVPAGWNDVANMTPAEREEAGIEDEDYDANDIPAVYEEADILALLTPEEREDYEQQQQKQQKAAPKKEKHDPLRRYQQVPREELDPTVQENLKRIETRLTQNKNVKASVSASPRPSLVSWLKELKAAEGTPIRGGNYWKAVAGATEVDDSGLVLLCPKSNVQNVFCDYAEYVTVVGNGQFLAKKKKEEDVIPKDAVELSSIGKVRKGREGDTCQTVRVTISEHLSTCSHVVSHAQSQFEDGIRGDPAANPLDRRAPRRLIHCNAMSASSLLFDETVQSEIDALPDDIAILSDRLNNHKYAQGSFLGRSSLRDNPLTNAYREINGAADGFPGWTVDRYGEYLMVQHDEKEYRGPLPSIHDGKTVGVYYLPSNPDRGAMGANRQVRPTLLEGRPAPDDEILEVLENGITYHVSLDRDLSTGMFLDQRPQRAWLSRNCNENTHVLNCFAHCGAFSVAAATAGASTVSLDLNKKWLDRVQPQLEANGVEFNERHDCIYGDCFEWLEKLAKRGETFDIVILDPPSSSVGKKKKRWSVQRDMEELVALAAPLVKSGGLLWTTTNSAGLSPLKFAKSCHAGFDNASVGAKLERIQPMPVDFPCIGPAPVKNLVWRIS